VYAATLQSVKNSLTGVSQWRIQGVAMGARTPPAVPRYVICIYILYLYCYSSLEIPQVIPPAQDSLDPRLSPDEKFRENFPCEAMQQPTAYLLRQA